MEEHKAKKLAESADRHDSNEAPVNRDRGGDEQEVPSDARTDEPDPIEPKSEAAWEPADKVAAANDYVAKMREWAAQDAAAKLAAESADRDDGGEPVEAEKPDMQADLQTDVQVQLDLQDDAAEGEPTSDDSSTTEGHPDTEQTIAVHDFDKPKTPFAARTDLEPNTLYRVEGRGDFYTDPGGTVTHVETTYGGRGSLNADLMKPRPDATYVVRPDVTAPIDGADHAHVFRTDELGRTVYVHTDALSVGDADRSESVQIRVGKEGGEDYDGGHLFGKYFGGGGEDSNIVAMLREVNRGSGDSFYNLENRWRDRLGDNPPPRITVDIRIHYPEGNGTVPDEIEVEYSIDGGEFVRKVFPNG